MKTIKLPLKKDPIITSECWTYYKMAIIETHSKSNAWLASHMKLMTTTEPFAKAFFGENMCIHNMHYYGDILSIEEITPLYLLDSSNFSKKLISEIDNGNYIVMFCNTPTLNDVDSCEVYAHEIMLYGYDVDREVFFVLPSPAYEYDAEKNIFYASQSPAKGLDGGIEVSFSILECAYWKMMQHWKTDTSDIYTKREIEFTISRMHLLDSYRGCNAVYDAIERIENEKDGTTYFRKSYDEFGNLRSEKVSATGIANIALFQKVIMEIIDAPFKKDVRGIPLSQNMMSMFRKFYEMRKLILLSINFIISSLGINDLMVKSIVDEYSECVFNMQKLLHMGAKFRMTGKTDILLRINDELEKQQKMEIRCLNILHNSFSEKFYEKEISLHNDW